MVWKERDWDCVPSPLLCAVLLEQLRDFGGYPSHKWIRLIELHREINLRMVSVTCALHCALLRILCKAMSEGAPQPASVPLEHEPEFALEGARSEQDGLKPEPYFEHNLSNANKSEEPLEVKQEKPEGDRREGEASEEVYQQICKELVEMHNFFSGLTKRALRFYTSFVVQADASLYIAEGFYTFMTLLKSRGKSLASTSNDLHTVARFIHAEELVRLLVLLHI